MPTQASKQIAVGDRFTILDSIGAPGNGSDGQSLRGQNVQMFPEGAIFYVCDSNRFYKLKKNQSIAIAEDTTGMDNVINGIGSSAVNGRFVATVQMAVITLTPGGESGTSSGTAPGWDVNPGGWFHVSYVTFGGTTGALRAFVASETTVTAESNSGSDSSDVFVTYYETPEGS